MVGWACSSIAARAQSQAPEGYVICENKSAGFRFFCPRGFKEIPVQPGDPVLLARYARALVDQKQTVGNVEIWVLSLPKKQVVTPSTGDAAAEKAVASSSEEEARNEQLLAYTIEEFVEKRLPKLCVRSVQQVVDKGRLFEEHVIEWKEHPPPVTARAWIADSGSKRTGLFAVVPLTDAEETDRQIRALRRGAFSFRLTESEKADVQSAELLYRRHPEFKDAPFRIERRRQLVEGWKAVDTPNYLIVYHSRDTNLLNKVVRDIEAMRAFYEELFPAVRTVEAVSVLRICRDRDEYLLYGGMPRTAGFWNFATEELVMFDNAAGEGHGNEDSYIVLKHEAFHQYIHYSTGELPPHSWFNEGFGDYFSGAVVFRNTGRIKEVETNPWRLPRIQQALADLKHVPLEKLVRAEQGEYYQNASLYYAQGWSFVFFLKECEVVARNPAWSRILPTYFETLKSSYSTAVSGLGESPSLADKGKAGEKARAEALEAAFAGVDFKQLESAWAGYVSKLR